MSKQKSDSKPAKKGRIINRKHNRTVNFDVARNEPKFKHLVEGGEASDEPTIGR